MVDPLETSILERSSRYESDDRGLVRASASWSFVDMRETVNDPPKNMITNAMIINSNVFHS